MALGLELGTASAIFRTSDLSPISAGFWEDSSSGMTVGSYRASVSWRCSWTLRSDANPAFVQMCTLRKANRSILEIHHRSAYWTRQGDFVESENVDYKNAAITSIQPESLGFFFLGLLSGMNGLSPSAVGSIRTRRLTREWARDKAEIAFRELENPWLYIATWIAQ